MSAIAHIMGNDLGLAAGSASIVDGAEEVRQRLLRRLCTSRGSYIWQPDFGTGLPRMIGDPIDVERVRGLILAQVVQDPGVDPTQPASVSIVPVAGNRYDCSIVYCDSASGTMQRLGFTS